MSNKKTVKMGGKKIIAANVQHQHPKFHRQQANTTTY
jgi:hypothetical protein